MGEIKRIGDFLERIKRPVDLIGTEKYKLVTVRLNHNGIVLREEKLGAEIKSKMSQVKSGDFILSGIDARNGAFGIIPDELDGAIVTNDFWHFDLDENVIDKHFFLELTKTKWFDEICRKASDGTTKRIRLKREKFFPQEIYLPNIDEQKEFLSWFKPVQKNSTELEAELTHQADLLKKLRQRILQEAIEGKLTAKWRAENPDVEPASALLERIQAEKAQLVAEKKIRKQKKLPPISEDEIPFELPQGWEWDNLGNCSINKDEFRIPISKDERARRDKTYDYYGASGVIDKIDGFTHEGRNLLIGEDGANLVARSTPIAFFANGKYWVNNHAHVIGTIDPITLDYLHVHINAIDLKPYVTGGFQPKLSQGNLNRIVIAVPPLAEQKAIVAKVETLLALCDELESEIAQNQENAENLMQAVLREAFSQEQA